MVISEKKTQTFDRKTVLNCDNAAESTIILLLLSLKRPVISPLKCVFFLHSPLLGDLRNSNSPLTLTTYSTWYIYIQHTHTRLVYLFEEFHSLCSCFPRYICDVLRHYASPLCLVYILKCGMVSGGRNREGLSVHFI